MKYLLLIIPLLLAGCEPTPSLPVKQNVTVEKPLQDQFTIESFGKFHAGYGDNEREIIVITDTKTGKRYLGITDTGLMKMVEDDEATEEAIDTGLDLAMEILE